MTTKRSADAWPPLRKAIEASNAEFSGRYPGESTRRQPVHTVYGGAQVFQSDSAIKLGKLALEALQQHAPRADAFAKTLGLPKRLAAPIYARVVEKLRREPVEDFRIDFEDGYGNRPDREEDGHAASAAREVAVGLAAGTLPPSIGIRIKPLTDDLADRARRTLEIFLDRLIAEAGRLPETFVVTLPKVTTEQQVATLGRLLQMREEALHLPPETLKLELMVETPQAVINERGEAAIGRLVAAALGRCVAAHFGTYDYTASLSITAEHQHMLHPACDFARHVTQVALAGTGIWISDGATNVLPIPPHRKFKRSLTRRELLENRAAVCGAWKLHYDHVRHSLANAYYQGWDLHPAQLPTRYAALYAFFLEGLEAASARLRAFIAKAGQATLVGEVFDDAATGQGLLNYFLRAWACGAITEREAVQKSGLTIGELRSRSFVKILKGRRER
jgi:citrate lyase beta subunit